MFIKFHFKLGKNVIETFQILKELVDSRDWEEHKFLIAFLSKELS